MSVRTQIIEIKLQQNNKRSKKKKSTRDLTLSQKSVLAKGSTFVPTPTNVNSLDLHKDFDKFANQV